VFGEIGPVAGDEPAHIVHRNRFRTSTPGAPTRNRGRANSSTAQAMTAPSSAIATWSAVWKMTPVDEIFSSTPTVT